MNGQSHSNRNDGLPSWMSRPSSCENVIKDEDDIDYAALHDFDAYPDYSPFSKSQMEAEIHLRTEAYLHCQRILRRKLNEAFVQAYAPLADDLRRFLSPHYHLDAKSEKLDGKACDYSNGSLATKQGSKESPCEDKEYATVQEDPKLKSSTKKKRRTVYGVQELCNGKDRPSVLHHYCHHPSLLPIAVIHGPLILDRSHLIRTMFTHGGYLTRKLRHRTNHCNPGDHNEKLRSKTTSSKKLFACQEEILDSSSQGCPLGNRTKICILQNYTIYSSNFATRSATTIDLMQKLTTQCLVSYITRTEDHANKQHGKNDGGPNLVLFDDCLRFVNKKWKSLSVMEYIELLIYWADRTEDYDSVVVVLEVSVSEIFPLLIPPLWSAQEAEILRNFEAVFAIKKLMSCPFLSVGSRSGYTKHP